MTISTQKTITLHGVFMNIFGHGVLLTGESGSGKSELALVLLDRGHQLIADDAPMFILKDGQTLVGACPPSLQNQLEIRGLGIFDITLLFGKKSMIDKQTLSLVIHLQKTDFIARKISAEPAEIQTIMNVAIPHINLPYDGTRRYDILVETLVHHHINQQAKLCHHQSKVSQGVMS